MELQEALVLFLGEYPKATTRRAYEGTLRPFTEAVGKGRDVGLVRDADVLSYGQKLKKTCKREATYYKHVKTIKRFFNWLVGIKEIVRSPATQLKQARLRQYVDKDRAATEDDADLILAVCFGDARNYAMAKFLFDSGCRAGGVANLTIENLDLDNLRAWVTEKGDFSRWVFFTAEAAQAIRVWLVKRPHTEGDHVFVSANGEPMKAASVSQVIRRASVKGGGRSIGAHSFRHKMGHDMADNGVPVTVAAEVLGHRNTETTWNFYYPKDMARAEKSVREVHAVRSKDKPVSKIVPFRKTAH